MLNFKGILPLLILISLLFACINSGQRENPGLQTGPEDGMQKKGKQLLNIAGFGFARTVDKSMAETWAMNNALASLAEQAGGVAFVYTPGNQELKLTAESNATFTGLSNPQAKAVSQNGKYWEAYTVYSSNATIEIPAGFKTWSGQIQIQATDLQNLAATGSNTAFKELTRQQGIQSSALSGKIYLEAITILQAGTGKEYSITALFFVVYKQD